MKRLPLVLSLVVLATVSSFAQSSLKALFNGEAKLVFLGYDFSETHFIGSADFADPNAIQNKYLATWNSLMITEADKYSLQEPFKLTDQHYETNVDYLTKNNYNTNVLKNTIDGSFYLEEDQVKSIVEMHKFEKQDAVGLVYVVESLNKLHEKAYVWVTFVDLNTGKVLHTEKLSGKPGGFGFRNYWAGAFYSVRKAIDKTYYKKWSKLYK